MKLHSETHNGNGESDDPIGPNVRGDRLVRKITCRLRMTAIMNIADECLGLGQRVEVLVIHKI